MSTDVDEEEKKQMTAFEAKLRSPRGASVRYQKNTNNPKKGSLRLDADGKVLILKRVTSRGYSKESKIQWKDVAGVFGSTDRHAKAAIVLIGATRHLKDRHVGIDAWRFTIDEDNAPSRDKIMALLRSKGDVANGVLTNIFPTHASNMTGETLAFSVGVREEAQDEEAEEGVGGVLSKHIPQILDVCEQMFNIGEKAAVVAPIFALLAAIVANYETVQGLKGDFIDLLARWSKIEGNLVGEGKLKQELLALAEDFFLKPGWLRRFASKDYQSDLARLKGRMNEAAQGQVLENISMIKADQKVVLETTSMIEADQKRVLAKIETTNERVGDMHALLLQQQSTLAPGKSFDRMSVQSILPQKRKLMGRREELKVIGDELELRGAIVALSGVGGCGKSHLGIEAALQWTRKKESLRVAFFVSAENETSCRSSLLQIMKMVGLDPVLTENGKPIPTEELFQRVYKKLDKAPSDFQVLWVLDNVPVVDGLDLLSGWFGPAESCDRNRFCYLLTSQSTVYCGMTPLGDIEMIEVDPLPTDVSIDLLMKNFRKLQTQEDEVFAARELVEKFCHNLPVAILAVAGMINRPMTFRGYLTKLQEKKVTAGVDSVAAVLQDALSHARQHNGVSRMLDVAAFVNPDDIPLSLLKDEDSDESLVGRLCELNLLQVVSHERYSMHRLIQETARVGRSAAHAIGALESAMDSYDDENPTTWAAGVSMLTHVESLRSVADVACVLSSALPQKAMLSYGRLMHRCGVMYGTVLCKFFLFRQLQEDALRVYRAVYGETAVHADIARTLHRLGIAYSDLGDVERAIEFYEQALTMKRAVYGETAVHPDIGRTLNNLGGAYLKLGDVERAIAFCKQALTMYRAVHGETAVHSDIGTTLHNLGVAYVDLGKVERAIELYEQALTMYRAVYGETAVHSDMAGTLHNLGAAYGKLGDVERAIKFYKHALTMYRAVYGEIAVHWRIATALNSLGLAYDHLGDIERAIEFYELALTMYLAVYGETAVHSSIGTALHNLGAAYMKLGDVESAIEFGKQALTMYRALYGETAVHSSLAMTLNNLGSSYKKNGDVLRAIELYEQALTLYRTVYGETAVHSDIARTLHRLGSAYKKLGDVERAIEFSEQALTMYRAVYIGNDQHPSIQRTLRRLKKLEHKRSG